jgi:hypothetical protein
MLEARMAPDFPFDEISKACEKIISQGHTIHQKFTCSGCKSRLTIDEPNVLYTTGTCDKCETVTDIQKQGCNYMVIISSGRFRREE